MSDVAVSDVKRQLGALIDRVRLMHEPVFLTRRGRRVVVIVDVDDFNRLRELASDAEDALAAVAARQEVVETRELPVPWDEVKEELGLA